MVRLGSETEYQAKLTVWKPLELIAEQSVRRAGSFGAGRQVCRDQLAIFGVLRPGETFPALCLPLQATSCDPMSRSLSIRKLAGCRPTPSLILTSCLQRTYSQ